MKRVMEMLDWAASQRPYIVGIELLVGLMVSLALPTILMKKLSFTAWPTFGLTVAALATWIVFFNFAVCTFTFYLFKKEGESRKNG